MNLLCFITPFMLQTWQTGRFKLSRLETPCLQTGTVLQLPLGRVSQNGALHLKRPIFQTAHTDLFAEISRENTIIRSLEFC